jgi:methionyl aminopeptidase
MIHAKSSREIQYMRDAGRIVAETHAELAKAAKPGVSTKELDQIAEDYIISRGAIPSFKGYHGFPATICASVNHVVVHGIPGLETLKNGDIISIDIGAILNGYHGDAARTLPIGEISETAENLLQVTEESLYKGIEQAVIGNRLSDISHAVQTHVEDNGFSVVRGYCGHGIGRAMHEEPQIPNYGNPGQGPRLKAGYCLAIEPMVNVGTHNVSVLKDRWTVVTNDKQLSAHFEHSVAVTEDGPLILTEL